MSDDKSHKDKRERSERFGFLGVTKQTELTSLTIFAISFWLYIVIVGSCHIWTKKKNWLEMIISIVEHGASFFPVALALVVTYETIMLRETFRSEKRKQEIERRAMEIVKQLRNEGKEDT